MITESFSIVELYVYLFPVSCVESFGVFLLWMSCVVSFYNRFFFTTSTKDQFPTASLDPQRSGCIHNCDVSVSRALDQVWAIAK